MVVLTHPANRGERLGRATRGFRITFTISQQASRVFISPASQEGSRGLHSPRPLTIFISIYVSSIEAKKERERKREKERERESYKRERSYLVRLADRRRSYTKENRDRKRGEMDWGLALK